MESIIIGSVIAFLGTLIGSLIAAYPNELKGFITGSTKKHRDLIGDWECKWIVDSSTSDKQTIIVDDVVRIVKISGARVIAEGICPSQDNYIIKGHISKYNVMTLTYESEKDSLTGVAILKLDVMRKQFAGYWNQLSPDGKFIMGSCIWKLSKLR
jgi:hypothetical protein